jgi:hypothetical protein
LPTVQRSLRSAHRPLPDVRRHRSSHRPLSRTFGLDLERPTP